MAILVQDIRKAVRDALHNLLCNVYTDSLIEVVPFEGVKAGDAGPWYVQLPHVLFPLILMDCNE